MSLDQDVGVLQGQVEALTVAVDKLTAALADTSAKQATLQTSIDKLLSEGKGGWKVLLFLSSCLGALAAIASWLMSHIKIIF
jgi:hypothetical protein